MLLRDVKHGVDGAGDDDADGGLSLKDGVGKDRILSVHDPEMRHGHESKRRRFDGHKAAVVVGTDTQLITAVDVLSGNAWDSVGALEMVEQSEASAGLPVAEAMGDTAYGDGGTRQEFADSGRRLVARLPGRSRRPYFAKEDFRIDLVADTCTCPAGNVAVGSRAWGTRTDHAGRKYRLKGFRFAAAVCADCPLRPQCIAGTSGAGRTVQRHPQEGLFQEARALQESPVFAQYRQLRVVVEHRLARLVQLGIRQARYFGRAKTKFQLYLSATVANLTLLSGQTGPIGDPDPELSVFTTVADAHVCREADMRGKPVWALAYLTSALLPPSLFSNRAFRLNF